ncbi:uncharacterized protein LOC110116649 [Dendrobium catenatum]|uniref:DUF7963 domain-containing protein n=1 Tax=Dendrobium catenatum TaxID=906689 RepID=A0A2I0WI47_9ASPA|nr:uncharacterized protein LOC110116649 [Dendrobium catenatum]PKU75331.1 hypothetical protein MA16_Dca016113 [Dendrobium catenatum]
MMAAANALATGESSSAATAEATARAASRRYEALVSVRTKAMKGKGAWYWVHLEPVLVHGPDSNLPKAVKLRCSLCEALFSASNPSRTASEHLKRGTCPNFTSAAAVAAASIGPSSAPTPISSLPPCRKRSSLPLSESKLSPFSSSPPPLALPALPAPHHRLALSGGKEDIGALAMLEDSVKRLKSPKGASPGPALSRPLADAALSLLADWLFESGGAASPSSLDHPKLRAFFHQVGLPALSPRRLLGPILDSRFHDANVESATRSLDAPFFQLDTAGWNTASEAEQSLISLAVNLPNGTTVFHRAMLAASRAPSDYAEDVFRDAIANISSGSAHRCAGIVADRFKSKALRNLETQNHWMVNVHCQLQGFHSLIKDFTRDLPIFHSAASKSSRLAEFFNTHSLARSVLQKYQLQELNHSHLLHCQNFNAVLDDVIFSSHSLQLASLDEDFKLLCLDDSTAREISEFIQDPRFWNELQAVHSLVKLVEAMSKEMEAERPLIGQCLPLWDELRSKVKSWLAKFNIEAAIDVDRIVERRFKKNYHPAWSAAFILDPLYLTKDASGKYLPPFKFLTPEQEKDVDRLITRLVSREEAHIVLMELMKWRTEGLDPLYAQAVQVKQVDPATGKMRVANPQSSRLVWETCLSELRSLGRVAVRLIFLHATACRVRCSPGLLRVARRSRAASERVEKMMFVAAQARFERRSFSDEEEKDAEIFGENEDEEASSV